MQVLQFQHPTNIKDFVFPVQLIVIHPLLSAVLLHSCNKHMMHRHGESHTQLASAGKQQKKTSQLVETTERMQTARVHQLVDGP